MNQIKVVVTEDETGLRFDSIVPKINNKISRTLAGELIKNGQILLDGKKAKVSTKVNAGQVISMPDEVQSKVNEELIAEDIPIDILYEDDDIVVVNKPKNMVVHPAARKLDWHTC